MNSRISDDVKELFVCFCEVAPNEPLGSGGIIILKYPENYEDKEILDTIPKFVYPCDFDRSIVQHFSFVLTNINSKWRFGFCRHDPKTSTALVYLSHLPWHEVFQRILNTTADVVRTGEAHDLTHFLRALLAYQLPEPGIEISVRLNDKLGSFHCIAPAPFCLPSIHDNRNISEYYNAVDASSMIAIFASMLHERRIIMKSRKLPRLSACVQAANTLLYPMSWQHIFIPLMPAQLTDYLLAPMPYLIGVPTPTWENIRHMSDIGDVVVFDLDNSQDQSVHHVENKLNDVDKLPQDVTRFLKTQLKDKSAVRGDGLARTFLRALVQLIGGYRDALKFQQGEKITFSEEAFVESRPTSMQPFLREMLHLQIFRQFIEERLDNLNAGLGFSDHFELEATSYTAKSNSAMDQYNHWVTHMKKHGTAIFKSVKSKTNPAMKSAVRKVKESGKDVKSAYKDIKTRIKKDGHTSHSEASNSTFHFKSRPLTIGSPIASNATYTKPRVMSSVSSSNRSNEYVPLSSPAEEVTSPAAHNEGRSEMNLLADIEHAINQKCSLMEASPPVDRTLKPVRSLDASSTPTSDDVTPHRPLTRASWSLPLESPSPGPLAIATTNPFNFPGPLMTDPFGFTPFATTNTLEPSKADTKALIQLESDKDINFDPLASPKIHPMLQWINSEQPLFQQPKTIQSSVCQHYNLFQSAVSQPSNSFQSSVSQPSKLFQSSASQPFNTLQSSISQPSNLFQSSVSQPCNLFQSFVPQTENLFQLQNSQSFSFFREPSNSLKAFAPQSSNLSNAYNSQTPSIQPSNPIEINLLPDVVPPLLHPRNSTIPRDASQCNGTHDLIRLDSESSHDNSLSRDSSDDSIKFKTGITNPLYPYTTPLSNSADTVPSNGIQPLPPYRNNPSFVHSKPKSSYLNEKDMDLLKEYGIDFRATATSDNNNPTGTADPFELPFEPECRPTPSTWATFE